MRSYENKQYTINGETLYRFVAYIGIDPVTGKQKQVRRSGFKTQRDAILPYAKITAEGDTKQLENRNCTRCAIYGCLTMSVLSAAARIKNPCRTLTTTSFPSSFVALIHYFH